jgi:hypothetical protein
MKSIRIITGLLLLVLLLTACQTAGPTGGTAAATAPAGASTDYPPAYQAAPEQPLQSGSDTLNAYPILPGDENKVAGNFFIEQAELRPNASDSSKTDLYVAGQLPTSCNEIRAFVYPPDENKRLPVRIYSVADKDKVCTQALMAYEGVVTTFSDIPAGTYTVAANDIEVGQLVIP